MDLQELDDQLGELERSRIYLPEMIQKLENELSELESNIEENDKLLLESAREQKSIELEIETDKEQLESYQKQMKIIKTNKEYDALTTEIDTKKLAISDKEEKILALMATMDECKEKSGQLKEQLKEIKAGNTQQLEMLKDQSLSLQAKIDDRMAKRIRLAKDINRQIIGTYERVRKGKGGLVVVPIRKKACGGCFKQIPPQRIQEIRRGDKIFSCDNCGRILIWIDENNN